MGCDIHLRVERPATPSAENRYADWWELDYPAHMDNRDYVTFAILAGVRNSWGIRPIAAPRGLPEGWEGAEECRRCALGDHSYSWLTREEILEYGWQPQFAEDDSADPRGVSRYDSTWPAFYGAVRAFPAGTRLVFGFDS